MENNYISVTFANNDTCEVRQADDLLIPNRLHDRPQFFIAFEIKFIMPPAFPVEDEDGYLDVIDLGTESHTCFKRFWAPCMFLRSGNLPWNELSKKLAKWEVPLHKQPFMLHRISACADEMASKDYNKRRKVLPIEVSISIMVDYCVSHREKGRKAACIKKDKKISDLKAVPANEPSIRALEKEMIQETSLVKQCMVCLEGLQIGSEARRLPCSHVFHQFCISSWLRVIGFCPVCHARLPDESSSAYRIFKGAWKNL